MQYYKGWEIHESNDSNKHAKYWIRRKGFSDTFTEAPKFRTIKLAKESINNLYGPHKPAKK